MDATDRAILNMIQDEFPLTEKPFEAIGNRTGISPQEALKRIKRLKQEGYIRRVGLVLESKKLGYKSLLCAARIDPDAIEEVAAVINREPGVTHCYERDGELNLWFTITMGTVDQINEFISRLEKTFSIKLYKFPEKKTFKIKTFFPV